MGNRYPRANKGLRYMGRVLKGAKVVSRMMICHQFCSFCAGMIYISMIITLNSEKTELQTGGKKRDI